MTQTPSTSNWRTALGGYLALARVSNTPTCVTNVLVGCAGAAAALSGGVVDWITAVALSAAVVLLYIGGMALNDLLDAEVDRRERPGRPIPSGAVSKDGCARFVWFAMTLGLGIIAIRGVLAFAVGLVLVLAIIAYDLIHRKTAWAVVVMGVCRGLVYCTAAAAVCRSSLDLPDAMTAVAWPAAAMVGYIVVLSLIARGETSTTFPRWRAAVVLLLPIIGLAPAAAVQPTRWTWSLVLAAGLVVFLLASLRHLLAAPPRIPAAVQSWLAGICLVDAYWLTLLDQPRLALIAVGCFFATVVAQRWVPGS